MKTTVDYSGPDEQAKQAKALEDIRTYLGDRFERAEAIVKTAEDVQQFAMACSFLGIDGVPVRAWFDSLRGPGAYDLAWDVIEARTRSIEVSNV